MQPLRICKRCTPTLCTLILLSIAVCAQQNQVKLPVVKAAEVPIYPALARSARIEGTVSLDVTTDGTSVAVVRSTGAHKLLMDAAESNVKTWHFYPHEPTSFKVSFIYRIGKGEVDGYSNSRVVLDFPTRVEVQTTSPKVETQVSY